jgi:type II secretory pathway predicted ATPase ExeA
MKLGSLALILLVCASMSLVAQIHSPSTVRANDGRTSAIHVLTGDVGTGKTTLCRTVRLFSWAKELLRELMLRYSVALKDTLRSLIDPSSSITLAERVATIPRHHPPTQMSSACKGFPTS